MEVGLPRANSEGFILLPEGKALKKHRPGKTSGGYCYILFCCYLLQVIVLPVRL